MAIDFSNMTAKEKARWMVNEYTSAELAILHGAQSYTVSGKSLTRANLADIVKQRKYWEKTLAKLNGYSERKIKHIRMVDL